MRLKLLSAYLLSLCFVSAQAQKIGDFTSIQPGSQTQLLQIPSTHTFQSLVQTGIILPDLSIAQVFPDFTAYIPKNGSSTEGYLCINHEVVPGGVTVLEISFDQTTKTWNVDGSKNVDFLTLGGSGFNCSGGTTPWGTSITSEENYDGVAPIPGFPLPDLNQDGYIDLGWNTEIDPVTGTIVDHDGDGSPDKLWKLGRLKHENVAAHPDRIRVFQGADDGGFGFLYKFVADVPEKLGEGKLFALIMDSTMGDDHSQNGRWVQVPNGTAEECNTVQTKAAELGATNFKRIEDVEVGPDGMIYFAATTPGNIYRLQDVGEGVTNFETWARKGQFLIQHQSGADSLLFEKCDNLAFDCDGNLWVTEDGTAFHVWVIGANHTSSQPNIRLFMTPPASINDPSGNVAGAEPTGLTFSPDCQFGFISLQRCSPTNITPQTDAADSSVLFNRDMTMVFARKEALGTGTIGIANKISKTGTSVYPQPAGEYLNIKFNSKQGIDSEMELFDASGRRIANKGFKSVAGENLIKFDTFVFPAGTYVISVKQGENQVLNQQIVIK